jgi:hypothetical protein
MIVVAWAEKTKLVETGRVVLRDRNLFPEMTHRVGTAYGGTESSVCDPSGIHRRRGCIG